MNAVNIPLIDPAMNIELPVTHPDDSGEQRAGAVLGARERQLIIVLILSFNGRENADQAVARDLDDLARRELDELDKRPDRV